MVNDPNVVPTKKQGSGCLGLGLLVVGLMVACGTIAALNTSDEPAPPSSFEAELQCQEWVKDKLRAPGTAEFSETTSTGGPASWTVTGLVDAENGFGALLRSSWTCDIRLDGDTWRGRAVLSES